MEKKIKLTGNLGIPVEAIVYNEKPVVSHKTLQNVVNTRNISYTFTFASPAVSKINNNDTVIATCTMNDPITKRTVSAVGDASKLSCITELEKKYPALIATNRAFDRAAIQMLAFKETVYSSSEISALKECGKATAPEAQKAEEPAQPEAPKEEASKEAVQTVTKEGRPDLPEGIEDIIQIGYVKGKSYAEIKDTKDMTKLISFLKSHPNLEYPREEQQAQAEWFRTLD